MKWLLFALQILPAILEAIKAVEAAIPGSGQGEVKKALVESTLAASGADPKATEIVGKLVDSTVATLNAVGVLQHAK